MGLINLNPSPTSFYNFSDNPFSPAIAYPGDPNGVLGTLRLTGNNAGWQGFQFADVARSLLVSAASQGFYAPYQWLWRFTNGILDVGSVPASLVTPAILDGNSGTYVFLRNPPDINSASYAQGNIELRTSNSSRPLIGFHRTNIDAIALYYDGGQNLRVRVNTGEDYRVPPETSGTWTPVFRGHLTYGAAGYAAGGNIGRWNRIGNMVHANFLFNNVVPAGIPATENIVIAGLPFFAQNLSGNYGILNLIGWVYYNLGTGYTFLSGRVPRNTNYCELIKSGSTLSQTAVQVSAVTSGQNWLYGDIVYEAA